MRQRNVHKAYKSERSVREQNLEMSDVREREVRGMRVQIKPEIEQRVLKSVKEDYCEARRF